MELPNGLRLVSEIWINQIHIPRHIFFTKGPHMANNSIKSYSKVKWYKLILYCPKSMYFQSFELTLDMLSIIFLPLKGIWVPRIPLKFGQWHPTHWGGNAKTIFFWLQVCKRYIYIIMSIHHCEEHMGDYDWKDSAHIPTGGAW